MADMKDRAKEYLAELEDKVNMYDFFYAGNGFKRRGLNTAIQIGEYIDKLEKENAELKGEAGSVLDNWCKGDDPCTHLKKRDEQLTKAKDLLLKLSTCLEGHSNNNFEYELIKEAEQFLNSEVNISV